jgi:predicted nucleotidyltransferase
VRLKKRERELVKKILSEIFGECEVYLFGSRVDDAKSGGDVDLFVVPRDRENLLSKKARAKLRLEYRLHKPVDLIVHENFERLIEQEALRGIKL